MAFTLHRTFPETLQEALSGFGNRRLCRGGQQPIKELRTEQYSCAPYHTYTKLIFDDWLVAVVLDMAVRTHMKHKLYTCFLKTVEFCFCHLK